MWCCSERENIGQVRAKISARSMCRMIHLVQEKTPAFRGKWLGSTLNPANSVSRTFPRRYLRAFLAGLLAHGVTSFAGLPTSKRCSGRRHDAMYSCGAASGSNGIPFSSRDLNGTPESLYLFLTPIYSVECLLSRTITGEGQRDATPALQRSKE